MAALLIDRGADVDKADDHEETPLFAAASVSIDNFINGMCSFHFVALLTVHF